jgi:hypothetical protein
MACSMPLWWCGITWVRETETRNSGKLRVMYDGNREKKEMVIMVALLVAHAREGCEGEKTNRA